MTNEDWLEWIGETAREASRRDKYELARLASTEQGKRLLAPLDPAARARMVGAFHPGRAVAQPRRRRVAAAASALLAVAMFALWRGNVHRTTSLPDYEVSVSGPRSTVRGGPGERALSQLELHAESPFELVFRPNEDVSGPLTAQAFLVEGAQAHTWRGPVEVSPEGAVRIKGSTDSLFAGRRGDLDLLVIVARPGAIPDDTDAVAASASPGDSRRVARVHLKITP
jgi:hypothetical protein